MPVIAGAGAAGAAATATAVGAFKYNRANYLYDASLRFQRYIGGYQFAMAQAAQYREDIRDFTELTVGKQETFTIVGTVFINLSLQIILAGRLGVHGPAPPDWFMGIYWCNTTGGILFLLPAVWLSLHASARAAAGGAHMLTRSVRLPLPTAKQLDKARKTGNSFEQQRVTDTFRIPFVAPAPKEVIDEELGGKAVATGNRRMPKWFQDEQRELHVNGSGPAPGPDATPEHFELYRGLQQEWFLHEAYVRIGLLYFISHWLTSVQLYSQAHALSELRVVWPAFSTTPIFATVHWALFKLDTVPDNGTFLEKFRMENIHPFMPFVTCLALSLDYSSVPYSDGWRAIIYILSWVCYLSSFLWIIKLYDLAQPRQQGEHNDFPGQSWWPQDWWLPPAFNGIFYIVAPPKSLEPGQTCLQLEMKAAKGRKGATVPLKKQRETSPQLFPWKIFRGALVTAIAMWVFVIIARIFEMCHGESMLLKFSGRQVRWPSHVQPWVSPWTRRGRPDEMAHTGGSDRRLSETQSQDDDVAVMAKQLITLLEPLAATMHHKHNQVSVPAAALLSEVNWPKDFAPSLLASREEGLLAALANNGKGAIFQLPVGSASPVVPQPFVLIGVDRLGELVGASWGEQGLMLSTSSGAVAECLGMPASGSWPCRQVGVALPTAGSSVSTATVARVPDSEKIRAAVAFPEDSAVVLFESSEGGQWLPAGEVQFHRTDVSSALHLSFSKDSDEVLISSHEGGTMMWRVGATEPALVARRSPSSTTWQAACSLGRGRVAHLATTAGAAPQLLVTSTI